MRQMSRRKLLRKGTQAVLAGGAALSGITSLEPRAFSKSARPTVDYSQKLGVTPFLNGGGTSAVPPPSTMPHEVQAALPLASRKPVNLNELTDASGTCVGKQLRSA